MGNRSYFPEILLWVLEEFARAPPSVTRRKQGLLGTNQLVWDLGVDDVNNEAKVEQKIKEMDEKFHLVMILEKFEVGLLCDKHRKMWKSSNANIQHSSVILCYLQLSILGIFNIDERFALLGYSRYQEFEVECKKSWWGKDVLLSLMEKYVYL